MKNEKRYIFGYALLFNVEYDYDYYIEKVAPGALDGANLKDVRILFNHSSDNLLGRTKSGTLTLKIDSKGLFFRAELPDTKTGDEMAELIGRNDLSQCSWGFSLAKDGDVWTRVNGREVRTLTKVRIVYDVSPVTYPACPDTYVSLESPTSSTTVFKSAPTATDDRAEMQRQIDASIMKAELMADEWKALQSAKKYREEMARFDSPEFQRRTAELARWERNF